MPHSTPPIRLVIFDWAGTTIDHGSCAPAAAFIEGFRRHGVDVTPEQARGPMGMGKRDHIAAMTEMPAVAEAWQRVHGRPVTDADIDAMYDEFVPVLMEVLPDYCELIPGVVEAVSSLREMDCHIGSTTGYFTEAMELCRERAADQGYAPDSSLAATQVSAGRPAPWLIFETMRRTDCYPPAAVVKVGDTVPDIEAGHNAGVWTVGVARTGNGIGLSENELTALPTTDQKALVSRASQTLHEAGAHFVVDSVADMPQVVAHINAYLQEGRRP